MNIPRKILTLTAAVLLSLFCMNAFAAAKRLKACEETLAGGLNLDQIFFLHASGYFYNYGHLPKSEMAESRVARLSFADDEIFATEEEDDIVTAIPGAELKQGNLRDILSWTGLSLDDWRAVQGVEFSTKMVMGTKKFNRAIDEAVAGGGTLFLTPHQGKILKRINEAVDNAREKAKVLLAAYEELAIRGQDRILSEAELNAKLQELTRNPTFNLKFVSPNLSGAGAGASPLVSWRYSLFIEQPDLRERLEKILRRSFADFVDIAKEIPETDAEIFAVLAEPLKLSVSDAQSLFGDYGLFKSVEEFIKQCKDGFATRFMGVVDRRIFTKARQQKLVKAVRNASDVIFFKLAENQDVNPEIFAMVEKLAAKLKAPIVVSPAFSEVGLIPDRLAFLLNHPNVHIQIDPILQLTKNFYVVNNGSPDKVVNPLVGLEANFQPTDRVLLYHPRILTKTSANGYYDLMNGYMMTTSSISTPAYRGEFNVSMTTDLRAQLTAEANRGVTVLSRRYRNPDVNAITGGAYGMAGRRVLLAEPRYGNPAGLFDINRLYTSEGVVKLTKLPAIIPPDIHLTAANPAFQKAFFQFLVKVGVLQANPRYGRPGEFEYEPGPVEVGAMPWHDLPDGGPNNGHTFDQLVTRATMDSKGLTDLDAHFRAAVGYVNLVAHILPKTKFLMVSDNHGHDWIMKRLQNGDLTKGVLPRNLPTILRMMAETISEGGNPYERLMRMYGINTDNVIFVSKDQQYRIGIDINSPEPFKLINGTEIGQHTQYGVNGAKSISVKGLLASYSAVIGGHAHDTQEEAQGRRVGTGSDIRQGYHQGPSKSETSLGIVYAPEAMQILRMERETFIPDAPIQPPEEFFPGDNFPFLRPWPRPLGSATDQFRHNPPVTRIPRGAAN